MSGFYLDTIFVVLTVLTLVGLGMMLVIEAALERIRKLEEAQAKMSEPLRSLIAEAQGLCSRLLREEEDRQQDGDNE